MGIPSARARSGRNRGARGRSIRYARHGTRWSASAQRIRESWSGKASAGLQFPAADLERQIRRDDTESSDDVDESRWTDNLHRLRAPGVAQRQQQPGQAGDMVAVHVADEDEVDVLDAPAEAPQADLCAFAAIEEQQVPPVPDQRA